MLSRIVPILAASVALMGCDDETETAAGPAGPTTAETVAAYRADLDACGLPQTCEQLSFVFSLYPASARTCVLDALAAREAIHVSMNPAADGNMESAEEVYATASGRAIVLYAVGEWGGTELNKAYWLQQCTVRDPTFFVDCRDQPYGPNNDGCIDWFSSCTDIREPVCP